MSPRFESGMNGPVTEQQLEDKLDALLATLPPELQKTWERRIEGLPLIEQVRLIESAIAGRVATKALQPEARLMPEGITVFESFPDDVRANIEIIQASKRKIEVGSGKAARVIASPSQTEVCHKIVFPEDELPPGTNDIADETILQDEVNQKLDGRHGVLVPRVFAFINDEGTRAITMELLNGPSLESVIMRREEAMPEEFDMDKFFEALDGFVLDMHAEGYHHRDIHWGNVLVHRETGLPCVIDFGLTKFDPYESETTYRQHVVKDGQITEVVLKSDIEGIKTLKRQVREYLTNNEAE